MIQDAGGQDETPRRLSRLSHLLLLFDQPGLDAVGEARRRAIRVALRGRGATGFAGAVSADEPKIAQLMVGESSDELRGGLPGVRFAAESLSLWFLKLLALLLLQTP